MTRPTGFICAVFVIYLLIKKIIVFNKLQFLFFLLITLFSILYYLPYILAELTKHSDSTIDSYSIYFFSSSATSFPIINNIIFYFIKLLYIFGFQESASQNLLVQITKTFFAIYFIIGFISLNIFSKNNLRFLVNMYLLITLLFLSPQWRYILPVSPILFLYSSIFFNIILMKVLKYLE